MAEKVPEKAAGKPELVIPPLRFQRLVREIISEQHGDYRFQTKALRALQVGTEDFMKEVMQEGAINCEAAGRSNLTPEDIQPTLANRRLQDRSTDALLASVIGMNHNFQHTFDLCKDLCTRFTYYK